MKNIKYVLDCEVKEEVDLFEEEIKGLLNDFYYNSKDHMYKTCVSIINQKSMIELGSLNVVLRNFCDIIFEYTINNLFWINEKGLWLPSKIYSGYLYLSSTLEELKFALKSIKTIIEDYEKMKDMSIEEIENSNCIKYIEEKLRNEDCIKYITQDY